MRTDAENCDADGASMYSEYERAFDVLPNLRTQRLLLRKLTMHDAQDIFDYSSDPQVARYVLWDAHETIAESKSYIRYMMRKYRMGEPSSWAIEFLEEKRVIGTIGFMWYNVENRSAEVGYSLSRAYWNRGIMTEALSAVIRYGFERLDLNRIEGQYQTDNPASGAVMRKVGMRHEGLLRGRLYNKGRYVDVDLYAILRKDRNPQGTGSV